MRSPTDTIVERHIPCPSCTSSDAYCIYEDGHGHCYSCNYHNFADTETDNLTDFTLEYVPLRGITKDTLRFYDCPSKINSEGKPTELRFPMPNGSTKYRFLDKKGFYTKDSPDGGTYGKSGLFGRNKFAAGSNKAVIITEGELDAISLYQVTRVPVVSVHGASSARSDCSVERSWLNSFDRIYLAFDGDEPGRDAASAVASLFDFNKVYELKFPGLDRKDANDYLRHGETSELATLFANAKKFLPASIESSLDVFDKILQEVPKTGVSYPWPTLNFMTYGIRTGESVLITAPEGVGKTEVMHAIEHHLLTETNDAVGAIFLEEPKRRHLQALAGIELRTPVHLPDSSVSAARTSAALRNVVGSDDRLHVYSHFGSDDPDVILDTIRFLVVGRACRYILLDHITMVVSGLGGKEATTALDYLSTRLEMMVKELDFALILVSHVNDDGLTRGSRNISKVADIRIDLSRDIKAIDPVVRRCTHLMISKNRFCGRTGPAGILLFDPITYTLSEDMGDSHGNQKDYSSTDSSRLEAMGA